MTYGEIHNRISVSGTITLSRLACVTRTARAEARATGVLSMVSGAAVFWQGSLVRQEIVTVRSEVVSAVSARRADGNDANVNVAIRIM